MEPIPQPAPVQGDMAWFTHDRFGMFIHWGLYSMPARHEWVKKIETIAEDTYDTYFKFFNPDLFNPRDWARMTHKAGMKYLVITAKHHEGFCMWDSAFTDYKVTNTPCGRDLLKETLEAFRAEGLKTGIYYSLIDWRHPEFPIDPLHPMANHPESKNLNESRDMAKYREYLHNQVREIMTDYGDVRIAWFDFSYPQMEANGLKGKGKDDWDSETLMEMVRELQPGIIVNNRMDLPNELADIHTPEQYQPRQWFEVNGQPVYWETCQTFSGSWGYHRDEATWKSPTQLLDLLIDSVSKGGNLLMNVGPTSRGTFDTRAVNALETYAEWMELHGRAIYGCTQSAFEAPSGCRFTQNGNRLYLHVFHWPFKFLHVEGLAGNVEYAQLLNDGSEIRFFQKGDGTDSPFDSTYFVRQVQTEATLTLSLPVEKPPVVVPVIELMLK